MKESERDILLDILENSERPDKAIVELHELSRDVVITFEDLDDEWFRELKESKSSSDPDPYDGLINKSIVRDEYSYILGTRAAWRTMLQRCLIELRTETQEPEIKMARLILEREEAISMLRQVCEEFGDNDWEEDLHLSDVIEKHLWRNLAALTED